MCAQTGPVVEGGGRRGVVFPGVCVCVKGGGGNARGVGSGVSGFEVFVVVGGQEGGVQDSGFGLAYPHYRPDQVRRAAGCITLSNQPHFSPRPPYSPV